MNTALAAVKKEHAQASAAKAGAEKALAEKKAPLDAALAKAKALEAELEALAVEQKRSAPPPAKGGLASAAQPGRRSKRLMLWPTITRHDCIEQSTQWRSIFCAGGWHDFSPRIDGCSMRSREFERQPASVDVTTLLGKTDHAGSRLVTRL